MTSLTLKNAQARWVADQDDNQWVVVDATGARLALLPAKLSDREAMQVIRFGREFEQKAFDAGLEFGKQAAIAAGRTILTAQRNEIDALKEMNERIAGQLEQHIIGANT